MTNVAVRMLPLEPNVRTVVGMWKQMASTTIIHFAAFKIRSPRGPFKMRCRRDHKTMDWPVTMGYQPMVSKAMAAQRASPVVMFMNLSRKPRE